MVGLALLSKATHVFTFASFSDSYANSFSGAFMPSIALVHL
jgi:hypothetical protein